MELIGMLDSPFVRRIAAADYPGLVAFSARAEALPQFVACRLS